MKISWRNLNWLPWRPDFSDTFWSNESPMKGLSRECKHKSWHFLWWKYQIHHSKYQMIHFILHPVTRIRNSSYMSKESKSLKPLMKSIQLRPWVLKLGGSFRNIQSLFLEAKIFKYAFLGSLWVDSSSEWEGLLWSNMDGPDVFRTVRRICKHEIEKVFEKRVSK